MEIEKKILTRLDFDDNLTEELTPFISGFEEKYQEFQELLEENDIISDLNLKNALDGYALMQYLLGKGENKLAIRVNTFLSNIDLFEEYERNDNSVLKKIDLIMRGETNRGTDRIYY